MKKTIILSSLIFTVLVGVIHFKSVPNLPNEKVYKTVETPANNYPDKAVDLLNNQNAISSTKLEVITLTERNTIVFRGPVTGASVAAFQKAILEKSNKLQKSDVIYMAIDSPGGSVIVGNQLIDTVKSLPQKVKSVTLFSASMAFQMVQNFDERLITPSGTLMSHRASGGFEGEFGGDGKGELITRLNWILKILKAADENAAYRMQMSLNDYQKLIADEYWASGKDAVDDKAADRMVLLKCDESLLKKVEIVSVKSFFGEATLSYSGCPVITYPLEVQMKFSSFTNDVKKEEFERFINKLITDKRTFVKDYIVTNKIESIVK